LTVPLWEKYMPNGNYPGPETIQRQVLSNGITVLIFENFASESIVIEGLIRAGTLGESPAKAGLANFTAAMLMRGTQKRTFAEIYEDLESVGADVGFSSGYHTTTFSASSLVEDLDLVLDVLAQSLRQPTFPSEQMEQVRGQIMTGLYMRANDTRRMASLAFNELLYPDHPYGRSSAGYLESVPAINQKDIADFHAAYYGPRDLIIALVGAIKAEEALAKVTSTLGDWQRPQQQELPPLPAARRPDELLRTHVHMPEKTQADIILGLPGPLRSAPDYLDASLMNTILGVFGMMGRIGKSVREEQGLAYYAYSRLQGGLGPSPWYASAGVAPDKVEQTIASIQQEVARIQNELVPAEELADSQAYRTGSMPVSLETNSGLADIITDIELYELGLDYLQRYPAMIRAITPERIQTAAQKYLSTEQVAIAVAGPAMNDEG
jgi:zinc protease